MLEYNNIKASFYIPLSSSGDYHENALIRSNMPIVFVKGIT